MILLVTIYIISVCLWGAIMLFDYVHYKKTKRNVIWKVTWMSVLISLAFSPVVLIFYLFVNLQKLFKKGKSEVKRCSMCGAKLSKGAIDVRCNKCIEMNYKEA